MNLNSLWRLTRNRFVSNVRRIMDSIGLRISILLEYHALLEEGQRSYQLPQKLQGVVVRFCSEQDSESFAGVIDENELRDNLQKGHMLIAAFQNEVLIGNIWLAFRRVYVPEIEKEIDCRGGYVWQLFVMPEWRGMDLARTLLEFTLEEAGQRGKDVVSALVEIDNVPSRRAFVSAGFEATSMIIFLKFPSLKKVVRKSIV